MCLSSLFVPEISDETFTISERTGVSKCVTDVNRGSTSIFYQHLRCFLSVDLYLTKACALHVRVELNGSCTACLGVATVVNTLGCMSGFQN